MDSANNTNESSSVVEDRSELTKQPQQPELLQQSNEPQNPQEIQQRKEPNQIQKKQQLQDPQVLDQLQETQILQNLQELQQLKKPQQLQEQQDLPSTRLVEDKNSINRPAQALMDRSEPISFNYTKHRSRSAPIPQHQMRKFPGQPYHYAEKEPWSEEIVWPTLVSKPETQSYDIPVDYIRRKLLEPPKPKVKSPPPAYPPWMPIYPTLRREPPTYEQLSDMSNWVQIRFGDIIYRELCDDYNTKHSPFDRTCLVDEECSAPEPVQCEDVEYDELQQFSSNNETSIHTSVDTDYFEGDYDYDCGYSSSTHNRDNDDCDGNGAGRCLGNHECHLEYWV